MSVDRVNSYEISKGDFIMGTFIRLKAYGENAQKAIDKSIEKLKYIENIMSSFKEHSDIYKINANANVRFTKIKKETLFVIKKSIEYSKLSNGGFDVTIKPIVDMWNQCKITGKTPNEEELKEKLRLVDYRKIKILFGNVKLKNKYQKLDLGGIAKGYAADEVVKVMKQHNVKSAIIDLGGNVVTIGSKPDGELWKVGIQNPFDLRGTIIGYLEVIDKSVVTSGDYERFVTIEEKKYHHFLNCRTGYPVENGIKSVSIISNKSIDGDGLTSCCFAMGLEEAMELIEEIDDVEAIFIDEKKKIYLTKGLNNKFNILTEEFKLQVNV